MILWTGLWAACLASAAPIIQFDYSTDTSGFFASAQRRAVLELAADSANRFLDALSPLIPSGSDAWAATYTHPSTGNLTIVNGATLNIQQDLVKVFVGARDYGAGGTLALAYSGGWSASGSSAWVQQVRSRGQGVTTGPAAIDYGPWGGALSFNSNSSYAWHDQLDEAGLGPAEIDLYTVAAHELIHLLGVGPAQSWKNRSIAGQFTGSHAQAAGSSNNPTLLMYDSSHWAIDTLSQTPLGGQVALMSPVLPAGQRRLPTALDRAGLRDIGWTQAAAGDVDRNGQVDTSDILQILAAGGLDSGSAGFGWSAGDMDGDLTVGTSDILEILAAGHLDAGPYALNAASALSADAVNVPEPASMLPLVGLGGMLWIRRPSS